MNTNTELNFGDLIIYNNEYWFLTDWCRSCNLLWIETLGEKRKITYAEATKYEPFPTNSQSNRTPR